MVHRQIIDPQLRNGLNQFRWRGAIEQEISHATPGVALKFAQEVLSLDPDSAAAYHVGGCASMRLGKFEDAIKPTALSRLWLLPAGKIDSHRRDPVDADIGAKEEAAIAFDLDKDSGAADPALTYAFLLNSSMIAGLRRAEAIP